MAKFDFDFEIFKGCYCNGSGESVDVHGSVELDDESVEKLLDLMRENDGETYAEALELEEKLPDVYSALDDAYRNACFWDWAMTGYENGYFDDPEDLRRKMEDEGLFKFDIEQYREDFDYEEDDEIDEEELEDAKDDAFNEWIGDYYDSLDEGGQRSFLEKYYLDALDDYCSDGYSYDIRIPEGIVALM